ncbi:hypothetical protein IJT10_07035 [bacterium]|nr:hypothetical protein [bacterium]
MEVVRGTRGKLSDYSVNSDVSLEVLLSARGYRKCKFLCLGIDKNKQIKDQEHVFIGKLDSFPVSSQDRGLRDNTGLFKLSLNSFQHIDKFVFILHVEDFDYDNGLSHYGFKILQRDNILVSGNFLLNSPSTEKTLVVLEIYKKDVWRLNFVAQGYSEGLGPFLRGYTCDETTRRYIESSVQAVRAGINTLPKPRTAINTQVPTASNKNAPVSSSIPVIDEQVQITCEPFVCEVVDAPTRILDQEDMVIAVDEYGMTLPEPISNSNINIVQRGFKTNLATLLDIYNSFSVEMNIEGGQCSYKCYVLDYNGQIYAGNYVVSEQCPSTPKQEIEGQIMPELSFFSLNLMRLPQEIHKLLFILEDLNISSYNLSKYTVIVSQSGKPVAACESNVNNLPTGRAITGLEIYREGENWQIYWPN